VSEEKLGEYNHFSAIINDDGTPIVMFDRTADGIECEVVDDFDSALNSTQRLIDLGCKTLLCCLQ
jgi:LacI family transcriptional regulator